MPSESFRFIHASDFHLESPLGDLDVLPSHLRDTLAAAPWDAAKAVLEAALADNIDFVVLSGDLLSPQAAGPHGMAMLLDYFEKLNAKGTPVFWAAGQADDPKKWPEAAPLPPCVTLFPKDEVLSVPVQRAGRTICFVHGLSYDGRKVLHVPSYRTEPTDEYSVAVGYGTANANALAEGRFDYWALGSDHNRREVDGGAEAGAVYCGSPQGRCLSESGPHGYTVVDVDAEQTTRIHNIECDTVRYCNVEIDAAEIAAVGSVQNLIGERIGRLHHESGGRHLIIGWDISLTSGETLHTIGDAQDLLAWVRREYGHGAPSAWTASLTVRPPTKYPQNWQDEETILGDFLRVANDHRESDARDMNLLPMTEEHDGLLETTANLLAELSAAGRTDVLDQATLLGVELLRGGKPKMVQES